MNLQKGSSLLWWLLLNLHWRLQVYMNLGTKLEPPKSLIVRGCVDELSMLALGFLSFGRHPWKGEQWLGH